MSPSKTNDYFINNLSESFNGKRIESVRIGHKSAVTGRTLLLEMGPEPNRNIRGVEQ